MSKLNQEFLTAIQQFEIKLIDKGFYRISPILEDSAYYTIEFLNTEKEIKINYFFGPSGWELELFIYTIKGKFSFSDLLKIPEIAQWVNENRYKQVGGRNIAEELEWDLKLYEFSIPFLI